MLHIEQTDKERKPFGFKSFAEKEEKTGEEESGKDRRKMNGPS